MTLYEATNYIKKFLYNYEKYLYSGFYTKNTIDQLLTKIDVDILRDIPIAGPLYDIERASEREFTLKVRSILKDELFRLLNCVDTISNVAQKTHLVDGTIKHACQNKRLINVKKIGNTWLVDQDEVTSKIIKYITKKNLSK